MAIVCTLVGMVVTCPAVWYPQPEERTAISTSPANPTFIESCLADGSPPWFPHTQQQWLQRYEDCPPQPTARRRWDHSDRVSRSAGCCLARPRSHCWVHLPQVGQYLHVHRTSPARIAQHQRSDPSGDEWQ